MVLPKQFRYLINRHNNLKSALGLSSPLDVYLFCFYNIILVTIIRVSLLPNSYLLQKK